MAVRVPRRCDRCGVLVIGKCGCWKPRQDRPNSGERGYDWQWQKFRAWFIERHPRCEDCLAQGQDNRIQLEVHHIVKVRDDISKRFDEANCMTLCKGCHAARTLCGE